MYWQKVCVSGASYGLCPGTALLKDGIRAESYASKRLSLQPMRWSERLGQAQHIACCLLAATIPLLFFWSAFSIWLIILCWLLSGRFAATWRHFRDQPM
jgi:hypothetical protein